MIFITPDRQAFFSRAQLETFDDFFRLEGKSFGTGRYKKLVQRVEIGGETFFLKTQGEEPWIRHIERFLKGLSMHLVISHEAILTRRLWNQGFPVPEVVAWGEHGPFYRPRKAFLLLTAIEGTPLDKAYAHHRDPALMQKWGALTGRLHANGHFELLRQKDVLVSDTGALAIIDREQGGKKFWFGHVGLCADSLSRTFYWELRYKLNMSAEHLARWWEGYWSTACLEQHLTLSEFKTRVMKRLARRGYRQIATAPQAGAGDDASAISPTKDRA
jgi:hypothetical protein